MVIIPREPSPGVCFHPAGMALESGQVIKGIDAVESAGMDEAHEEVPHPGSVLSFVTEGVFPVQDGHLQGPFADVIVQGSAGVAKEQG